LIALHLAAHVPTSYDFRKATPRYSSLRLGLSAKANGVVDIDSDGRQL
jgi:hypothetical protein